MQHIRQFMALLAAALLLWGCAEQPTTQEKLDRANAYLSEYGGEAHYRAAALDLYRQVLPEAVEAGNHSQQVEAHFGIGMIGFLDLAQAVPELVASVGEDEDAPEEEGSDLPPADQLAEIIETLLHQVLGVGIVDHFAHVKDEEEFSFYFESLVFAAVDEDEEPLDLSGTWDLTEVRLLYGTFQILLAAADYVFAYDEVVETILEGVLSGADLPEVPTSVGEFPVWIVDAAEAMGLTPLPWLQDDFGVLPAGTDLAPIRARLSDGLEAMADGFAYLQTVEEVEGERRRFSQRNFVGSLISLVVDLPSAIARFVSSQITPAVLEEMFADLQASVDVETHAFVTPPFVWRLANLAGPLLFANYDELVDICCDGETLNPAGLSVPALNLSRLFTHPIEDIKDPMTGLLPWFDDEGLFALESESPAEGEHEYDDLTRDQEWPSPCGDPDPENGIVDPVYLFFCNADLNGLLVPTVEDDGAYVADMDTPYGNADLMRLVSHVIWIVESVNVDTL